ncbi:MAG: hypothetical protein ACRDVC_02935 [Acidimicrobiales bacterium]
MQTTLALGSLTALGEVLARGELLVATGASDVVVLPTAAAFVGATQAATELSEGSEARVEALMHIDRSSSDESYFAKRVREAHVVILSDGSLLHAKSVWHETPIGDAIRDAEFVVAVGSVVSVLLGTMIDPRGGAPTTGLGHREGICYHVKGKRRVPISYANSARR